MSDQIIVNEPIFPELDIANKLKTFGVSNNDHEKISCLFNWTLRTCLRLLEYLIMNMKKSHAYLKFKGKDKLCRVEIIPCRYSKR